MLSSTRLGTWLDRALYFFLLITPFVTYFADRGSTDALALARAADAARNAARDSLRDVRQSCGWDIQLKALLMRFQRQIHELASMSAPTDRPEPAPTHDPTSGTRRDDPTPAPGGDLPERVAAVWQAKLAGVLPAHTLVTALRRGDGPLQTLYCTSRETDAATASLDLLVRLMDQESHPVASMTEAATALSRYLRFPVPVELVPELQYQMTSRHDGMLVSVIHDRGVRGMFWVYPRTTPNRLMLAVFLDLTSFPATFGCRRVVAEAEGGPVQIALLPDAEGQPEFMTAGFAEQWPLQGLCRRRRADLPEQFEMQCGGWFITGNRVLTGLPYRALVATPLPARVPAMGAERLADAFAALALVATLVLVGRKMLTGRGPRLNVGVTILLGFVVVAVVPVGLARLVMRVNLGDREYTVLRRAADDLADTLKRIDEQYDIFQADHLERVRAIGSAPIVASFTRRIDPAAGDVLARHLVDQARPQYPAHCDGGVLMLGIGGPGGLRGGSFLNSSSGSDVDVFVGAIADALRQVFALTGAPAASSETGPESGRVNLEDVKAEIGSDLLFRLIRGMLGPDNYLSFLANPFRVMHAENSSLVYDMVTTKLWRDGAPIGLCWRIWSNYALEDWWLDAVAQHHPLLPLRGVEIVAVRKGDHLGYTRKHPGFVVPPMMHELIDCSRRSEMAQDGACFEASRALLLRAVPGKNLALATLAGAQPIAGLLDDLRRSEHEFATLAALAAVVAVLLAVLVFLHFGRPLHALALGIRRIAACDYDIRLDESRADEFGSLARSFNVMTQGLREGSLLGRFVSTAVQAVVRDKAAFAAAQAGERRTMTVVFSCLHGFDEYAALHGAGTVFGLLGRHLAACSTGVKECGGVIDKVIGDKVMMFFDHQALGGDAAAVQAAMAVVARVRAALADAPLALAIGVNTGYVVAGILGARRIHLDYTVIGDAVNLAARLTAMAHTVAGSRVVVSGATRALLPAELVVERLAQDRVKGKTQAIEAWLLRVGDRP